MENGQGPSSLTSVNHLFVFGTHDLYTNLKKLVLQERFLNSPYVFYLTNGNQWYFQVYLLSGTPSLSFH